MAGKDHLYDQISRNKFRSWVLIISVVSLLVVVGFTVGSSVGDPVSSTVVALTFSLVMSLISFYQGDKIVLSLMEAVPADEEQYRTLHNVVEEMSIAAGINKPKVYVITSNASNAFATGRNSDHASVAVTTGLLEILNREELQGVMGHEISHIKQRDTLYAVMMAVLVGAIVMLCDSFWRMLRYRRASSRRDKGGGAILFIALLLAIIAPILAKIIQLAMSRRREYLADNGGSELTRNPLGLANALAKIAGDPDPLDISNRGVQHLFIINPLNSDQNNFVGALLSTHPPIQERIRILRELAHSPTFAINSTGR